MQRRPGDLRFRIVSCELRTEPERERGSLRSKLLENNGPGRSDYLISVLGHYLKVWTPRSSVREQVILRRRNLPYTSTAS